MTTKIRVIETQPEYNRLAGMNIWHYYIEVLEQPYKQSDTLNVIGRIKFQCDDKRSSGNEGKPYYGLTYVIDTDKPEHIAKMAKLAAFIKENSYYDIQPEELIALIGGIKHYLFEGNFIPESFKGMLRYSLKTDRGIYGHVYAPNDIVAKKVGEKKAKNYNLDSYELTSPIPVV